MTGQSKEEALKAELAAQDGAHTPYVSARRYFDGNEDNSSIGCNLPEHPGIAAFRTVLLDLSSRQDVEAVYALIAEIDPGPGSWPFTDTILVFGAIESEELALLLRDLEPDEVVVAGGSIVPEGLQRMHPGRALYAWWD